MNAVRARRIDASALAVAIISISASAPIVVAFAGPALAIGLWRNVLGAVITLPFALRHRDALRTLSAAHWRYTIAAGVLLGIHFGTWIPSLRYTSIAASTALVATQVVWAALFAYALGHRAPRTEWIGIGVAIVGVVVLTGIDVSLDARALFGDLLSLLGAISAAAYVVIGQRVRPVLPLSAYTAVVYAVAAMTMLVICLATGTQLWGFSTRDWWLIIAITVLAQFGGHTLMNMALRSFSATAVSLAILVEVPGATLFGWVWPGQTPPWQLLPAAALILVGLAIVLRASRTQDVGST